VILDSSGEADWLNELLAVTRYDLYTCTPTSANGITGAFPSSEGYARHG